MGQRTLKEVLETYRDIDLLEDEHGKIWTVHNLIGAFVEGKRTWPEDAPPEFTLDGLPVADGQKVTFSCDMYYQRSICLIFPAKRAHYQRFRTLNTVNNQYYQRRYISSQMPTCALQAILCP